MTRNGSLAYYSASIAIGCLFMTLATLLGLGLMENSLVFASLFIFYFDALLLGWGPALLFSVLLRKMMKLLRLRERWHWAISGGALAFLLMWSAIKLAGPVEQLGQQGAFLDRFFYTSLWFVFLNGPSFAAHLGQGLWGAAPAGAATAFFLCQIHKRFEAQTESDQSR